MTSSEARRHGLYNVLTETIGKEETDTLMTYLPTQPHEVLATKADLTSVRDELGTRIGFVQAGVSAVQTDVIALRTEINGRIDSVNRRLDRLHLTLAAGLLALLGAAIVQAVL